MGDERLPGLKQQSAWREAQFQPVSKYGAYGSIKIECQHNTIETAYMSGWRLIEVLFVDEPDRNYNQCSSCHQDSSVPGTVVYRRPMFVMGKPHEEVLAEVQGELATERAEHKRAQAKLRPVTTELEETKASLARVEKNHEEYMANYYKMTDTMRKPEKDLGKVRTHIGEKEWRKVVDGNKDSEG